MDLVVTRSGAYDLNLLGVLQVFPGVSWHFRSSATGREEQADIIGNTMALGDGTQTLVIRNAQESDAGIYTARLQRLGTDISRCGQVQASCEKMAIPLLTHHAISRPVSYELTVDGKFYAYIIIIVTRYMDMSEDMRGKALMVNS